MKAKFVCLVLCSMLTAAGCGDGRNIEKFTYTQQRVCQQPDISNYDISAVAIDTSILIPGLAECYVPQGIAYWKERDWLLISGYFQPVRETQAAIIFALDGETGALVGEFSLAKRSGEALGGHFSGIAVTERELIITQEKELYRVSLDKIPEGGKALLKVHGEVGLPHSAGFCNYSHGMLWVGEHYNPQRHTPEVDNRAVGEGGSGQNARLVGYTISPGAEPGALCVLSIPDRIQGLTLLSDGRFLLSQSYGRKNASNILVFADPRKNTPVARVDIDGKIVPFWHLDRQYALANFAAPPMAEGCCAVGSGAYLIFESAAYFYRAMDADNRSVHPTDTVWYLEIK